MRRLAIIRVTHGIGNQLFQYAFARSLSLRFGVAALLDTSWFWLGDRNDRMQPLNDGLQRMACHLPRFNLQVALTALPVSKLVRVGMPRQLHLSEIETCFYHYDAALIERLRAPGPLVATLGGFWQSLGYFHEIRGHLRRETSPREPHENRALAAFAPRPCVAIHVRTCRLPSTFAGACGLDYYAAAIREVRSRVRDPKFLLFTDNLAWVRNEFCVRLGALLGDAQVMDNPSDLHNFLDMLVHCRHFIIANSTFGWWPAWLASGQGTIVVAPKHWFTDRSWTAELFPEDWVRI